MYAVKYTDVLGDVSEKAPIIGGASELGIIWGDMISQLRGTVVELQGNLVTIDVGGVGYEVLASRALSSALDSGREGRVLVYTDVKQDSIRLFGFADQVEKQLFMLLLRVTGVGSKTALEIVSGIEGRELLRAIGKGETQRLQGIKGIGKKTAERIVLELRDKVAEIASEIQVEFAGASGNRASIQDAVEALQALGFTRPDAEKAVQAAEANGSLGDYLGDPGAIVREALRFV